MKRYSAALTVLIMAGFLGQARGQDMIFFRDKDQKSTQANGTIQSETTNKVVIKSNLGKVQEIAAGDIIDITYELRGEARFDYNRAANAEKAAEKADTGAERKKLLEDAIKNYETVLPKAGSNALLARQIQYKLGMLRVRLAGDNKPQMDAAIADLQKFRKDHPNAWQTMNVLKTLGQALADQGKFGDAVLVFDDIIKVPGLDKDTKTELEISAAKYLVLAKKHDEAEKRLTAMLKSYPPTDPKVEDLRMMIIACRAHTNFAQAVKDLEDMIAKSKGQRLALAYNTLGDCYQMNNDPKEALYNYLFVDLIYNDDRSEHIKAVENIAKLFQQMKRPERAKEYEAKLEELKK